MKKALLTGLLTLSLFSTPLMALAYPTHMPCHPRRDQVNRRLDRQGWRINQGVRNGKLTTQQAQQLHQEDRSIHQQEVQDWKANGGYITKQQQRQLNQEENQTSTQIYQEKHP